MIDFFDDFAIFTANHSYLTNTVGVRKSCLKIKCGKRFQIQSAWGFDYSKTLKLNLSLMKHVRKSALSASLRISLARNHRKSKMPFRERSESSRVINTTKIPSAFVFHPLISLPSKVFELQE